MGITVRIKAGATTETSSVSADGSMLHIIKDSERSSFGIGSDSDLKNAVGKYFGKNPNDAYLHSPTPWNDLYTTYGWPQVQTNLVVQSAQILEITSEPVIVSEKTFKNNSSHDATFDAGISDQVTNTTESNWSNSNTVSFEQSIEYGISFLGTGGGGSTTMSYEHTWGQGGSESKSVTVGSNSGVSVTLKPGESVKAQLTASRGVMKVRIVYNAYLTGVSAVNYNPTYQGHHFWALDIGGIVGAAGKQNSIQITEDISVGYYSNSEVILTDNNGNRRVALLASPAIDLNNRVTAGATTEANV